jgi:hypothetical protein
MLSSIPARPQALRLSAGPESSRLASARARASRSSGEGSGVISSSTAP